MIVLESIDVELAGHFLFSFAWVASCMLSCLMLTNRKAFIYTQPYLNSCFNIFWKCISILILFLSRFRSTHKTALSYVLLGTRSSSYFATLKAPWSSLHSPKLNRKTTCALHGFPKIGYFWAQTVERSSCLKLLTCVASFLSTLLSVDGAPSQHPNYPRKRNGSIMWIIYIV